MRDGQLAAPDSDMISSHVQVCMHCAAERDRIERIGSAVRQIPVREPSALVVRIQRRKLLEEAAQQLPVSGRFKSGPVKGATRTAIPIAFAAAAALVLAFMGFRHYGSRSQATASKVVPQESSESVVASEVEVHAMPDTRWSQRSEPAGQLIALEQGELWTKISHKRPHPPVVFHVPDGQIEDIGTTFTVKVQNGRTQSVAVEEGAVLLHLDGLKEERVVAPKTWNRPSEGAQSATQTAPAPVPVESLQSVSEAPVSAAPVAEQPARAPATSADTDAKARQRAAADAKAAKKTAADESKLLKKGTAALHAGRYAEAVTVFERFDALYPRSARAEDAAYLHALSLARAGRFEEARSAAQLYLSRFPSGFRRTEMEAFVEASKR